MEDWRTKRLSYLFGASSALSGFFIIISITSYYGIGLTMDGASYVACARSLIEGHGFFAFDGRPYIHWPPLYPLILAGSAFFGADPVDILPWLHALIFALIVFGFQHILQKNLKSQTLVIAGTLTALLLLPIINLASCAYSEPLFILLSGCYIYYLHAFLNDGGRRNFILACLFVTLSCLQRYAGVTLPLAGAILVMAALSRLAVAKRLKLAAILCLSAYLPLGLWMARNILLSSRWAGFIAGGGGRLMELLAAHRQIALYWLFPIQNTLIWIPLAVIFGICVIILLWFSGRTNPKPILQVRNLRSMSATIGVCCFLYWVFILAAEWFSYDVDNNPHRFLAVIQLPFYYLVLAWIDRLMAEAKPGRLTRVTKAAVGFVAFLWVLALLLHTIGMIEKTMVNGPGLSLFNYEGPGQGRIPDDQKERVALCHWFESLPKDCPVYSNAAPFLYGLYGVKAMWAPTVEGNPEAFAQGVSGWQRPCAYIRFDLLSAPDYTGILYMQHVMDFPEGQAFLIRPKTPNKDKGSANQ